MLPARVPGEAACPHVNIYRGKKNRDSAGPKYAILFSKKKMQLFVQKQKISTFSSQHLKLCPSLHLATAIPHLAGQTMPRQEHFKLIDSWYCRVHPPRVGDPQVLHPPSHCPQPHTRLGSETPGYPESKCQLLLRKG